MSVDESQYPETDQETAFHSAAPKSRPFLTFLLCLGIAFAYVASSVVGVMIAGAIEFIKNPNFDLETWTQTADSNGFLFATVTIVSTIFLTPLTFAFAYWIDRTSPLEYLGFTVPSLRAIILSVAAILCFILTSDGLTWLLGREIVPPFMREVFLSCGHPAYFSVALVLGAPFVEEVIFRGFLYRGLIHTRVKLIGTALITSSLWAPLHTQYDLYGIATIFVGGLMLCYVRHNTQSIIPCILMHCTMNLVATLQVAYVVAEHG